MGLVGYNGSAVGRPTGWDINRPLQWRIFFSRKDISPYRRYNQWIGSGWYRNRRIDPSINDTDIKVGGPTVRKMCEAAACHYTIRTLANSQSSDDISFFYSFCCT